MIFDGVPYRQLVPQELALFAEMQALSAELERFLGRLRYLAFDIVKVNQAHSAMQRAFMLTEDAIGSAMLCSEAPSPQDFSR